MKTPKDATPVPAIEGNYNLPDCTHEACTEATCTSEVLFSPYWEQRRQDVIRLKGNARGDSRLL